VKLAVVIGATGLVGQELVQSLARHSEYANVLAIVRKTPNLNVSEKVRYVPFDFNNWSALGVEIKSLTQDVGAHFFCCLGTTMKLAGSEDEFKKIDHDYVVEFSKLANQVSAEKLIVISALGADAKSKIFYNYIKGLTEKHVAENFNKALYFVRPSLLLGHRNEFRLGENIAQLLEPVYSLIAWGPLRKFKPIAASQVARAMVELAQLNKTGIHIVENQQLLDL
jgi:uncharacterized protein YbjT (DUF2867 family)